MPEISEIEDTKELIRLCRAGRLYEIERWITAGKPLEISAAQSRGRQRTLLELAVDTGFYSLVELIARNEPSDEAKTAALIRSVSAKRMDIVELLFANGADPKTVPLDTVLFEWDPKLIRFFLDRGADPIEGRPFAEAFRAKIRTALSAFVEYKKAHPELGTQLQEQLDCALRHFCGEGDLKWISLLMWAGGDPHSRGPCLGKDWSEDPAGVEEACRLESTDVMKKLKPDPNRDDGKELLRNAAFWSRSAILEFLLNLGFNPNDKENGGSSALDASLRQLDFIWVDSRYGPGRLRMVYEVRPVLECVRVLLSHGATWRIDDRNPLVLKFRSSRKHCH